MRVKCNVLTCKVTMCRLAVVFTQGSTTPHLVKPMIKSIKELYECGDEVLQRDAGYIMTAMAGEPELTGDFTQHFLNKFLDGKLPTLVSELTECSAEFLFFEASMKYNEMGN